MALPDLQDAIDYLQEKDLDAAIAALERKIEELPAHLTAHVLLARAYEAKHQWTRALEAWENVHFLMPNSPVGQEGKARVLRRLDREEEAEDAAPSPDASSSEPSPAADPAPESGDTEEEEVDPKAPSDDASPSTASDADSELEQLRRQAEEEARKGGSRPELADAPSSPDEPSPSEASPGSSPEERVGQLEDEEEDLDRLIEELESARIEPRPDVDEVPTPDLEDDIDDLVSETLARIHEAQDQYRKAAQIYVKLASQEPDRARDFLEKAAEMRKRAEGTAKNKEQ